jgi:hypothetical protein
MKAVTGLYGGTATKFIAAVLGAGAESMASGHFDWKTLVAGAATALAVYAFPNAEPPVTPPAA